MRNVPWQSALLHYKDPIRTNSLLSWFQKHTMEKCLNFYEIHTCNNLYLVHAQNKSESVSCITAGLPLIRVSFISSEEDNYPERLEINLDYLYFQNCQDGG